MYQSNNNQALQKYLAKLSAKSFLSLGRNKEILTAILTYYKTSHSDYRENVKRENNLLNTLWAGSNNNLCAIFSGSEYKVLVTLFGKPWAEKFKHVWDRCPGYTYSGGYLRRSFRTRSNDVLFLSSAVAKLRDMIYLVANDFTYEKYFSGKDNAFVHNRVVPDLLALEIDKGNAEVIDRIRKIVYGDNNTGVITRAIIQALLKSRSSEAHKWVGELLLAAKLQEGLRQTIVECMDEGSKEGFLYILQVILDNDLIRFSSIARALDVWTGLDISAQKPAVVKKCLETGYRCLTDKGYTEECLGSNDALLIFMGLWSMAFDEVMQTEQALKTLMAAPEKYKRMVALYFLRQTQFPTYQHRLAVPLLDDPDYEVKGWVLGNLYSDANHTSIRPEYRNALRKYQKIAGICSHLELFAKLRNILDNLPKKELVFPESLFPWCTVGVSSDELTVKMLLTFAPNPSDSMVNLMLDYRGKMSADTRREFVTVFLSNPKTEKQKTAVVESMGDKSSWVRSRALKIVAELKLSTADYKIIENLLQYKAGDLRKNAITVLMEQPAPGLLASIRRLLADQDENKQLAALDIISAIDNKPEFKAIVPECRKLASITPDVSQKTRVLAEKITNSDNPVYSAAEGFGLFDPEQELTPAEMSLPKGFSVKDVLTPSFNETKKVLLSFSEVINRYKDFEYEAEDWGGSHSKVVLGGERHFRTISSRSNRDSAITLEDYPLSEVWRGIAREHNLSAKKVLEILFYYQLNRFSFYRDREQWFIDLVAKLFPIKFEEFTATVKNLPFANHIHSIFSALLQECPKPEVFTICRDMLCHIYNNTPVNRFAEDYEKLKSGYYGGGYRSCLANANQISFWYTHMRASVHDDESFKEYFKIGYALYKASEFKSHTGLRLEDFEKAFALDLVDENELYAELCSRPLSAENLRDLTKPNAHRQKNLSSCQKLNEVCAKVVDRIVSIELKRGDMTTEVSHLAAKIGKCTGSKFFVDILIGAEKDTYVRGYNFVGDDSTKKQIFSHLLKCCYPAPGEDENTLAELLQNLKVKDKQLIDAAMYAPQWLEIVEKYLNWPGLRSTGWYFHAHVNETFAADKETIVARFSPVAPVDFKSGAFDIAWFKEAYAELGEKRFKVVYDSAKYIAGGGLHKRAQLFADAVLGKLELSQAEKIISEKRNKDYVLCYGLIPLGEDKQEQLHRYEFLHGFLKESKQFGAQRRESEAKAVNISLENLARNAGYTDVNRFTWSMETEKLRAIEQYLRPMPVGDISIHIAIDDLGRAAVAVTKDGKALKDVPAKLKDNEYVQELKAAQKSLKAQHSRARTTLEKAMEAGDEFTAEELTGLAQNPVIYPLLQNLVFKQGDKLGYFRNNVLVGSEDQEFTLQPKDTCSIAHPVHLYASGEWAAFQRDIFNRKIVQPFKQVFRELYRPNVDELASKTISRRYAGHQIQPQKAAALLKGRGWTASYEEGLQKVYYKENLIAQIFALADWFSPADVEAPTIEGVQFFDRKTSKPVEFASVPEVIFSEIMRDVDLVVSVAHVGGVDPEASLSTVELRTAIIAELLRLLKLSNVELKGSHALINGTLGQYTVHLGSGVVHKMASGAVHILPVHSQHRGRIFLPFVDDDPKTAEITSKIIFLAEDSKIKDPNVLVQIVN